MPPSNIQTNTTGGSGQRRLEDIHIISYNCWGLKYISKHRVERMQEIGRRLATATPTPSIVGLQECWTQQDYLAIREHTKHILPYGKFYYSGIFGGGLAILSKFPIEQSTMYRYPLNGRPSAFYRGDWYVGKGVACARVRLGPREKDVAEIFTTHLHAPYQKEPRDSYICHRTAQAWEIAKLMRGAAERGHLVIAMGDFNMVPKSLAHQLITVHSASRDAWLTMHPDSSLGASWHPKEQARKRVVPTAAFNLEENGATCDSVLNTWRWDKKRQKQLGGDRPKIEVSHDTVDGEAQRLDYIFASTTFDAKCPANGGWIVGNVAVGMLERHPTLDCSLSDHFSVHATLTHSHTLESGVDSALEKGALIDMAINRSDSNASTQLDAPSESHLPLATYDEILGMMHQYMSRERRSRRWRLAHFLGSVAISIACLLGEWWGQPNAVSFVLALVSTVNLAAGVVNGLIGGLFVGSELRALKEFEWEIRNARLAAGGE